MRPAARWFLGLAAALVHCGAYMDVDDAPRTALQAGDLPRSVAPAESVHTSTDWPLQSDVHPAVANMPASAETSLDAVALYLAAREKDPLMLAKALHDWVADRVRYDRGTVAATAPVGPDWWLSREDAPPPAFALSRTPLDPPSAERAFFSRKGACGDYAMLFTELARHARNPDLEVRYVTGYARGFASNGGEEEGYHAWNVVHVRGRAYMADVTWDAGTGEGASYQRLYRTDYLFTPPDVFAMTHFPDWAEDQHTSHVLTRAEFDAQPLVDPRFYALALTLEHTRSPAKDEVQVVVDNPYGVRLAAQVQPIADAPLAQPASSTPRPCALSDGVESVADCKLDVPGAYAVTLFAKTGTTRVQQVARIRVSRDS